MSGVQCCRERFGLRHIYKRQQLSIRMKPIHNAVLYSAVALALFVYGFVQESQLSLVAAMVLAGVSRSSYWTWKAW